MGNHGMSSFEMNEIQSRFEKIHSQSNQLEKSMSFNHNDIVCQFLPWSHVSGNWPLLSIKVDNFDSRVLCKWLLCVCVLGFRLICRHIDTMIMGWGVLTLQYPYYSEFNTLEGKIQKYPCVPGMWDASMEKIYIIIFRENAPKSHMRS